MHLSPFSYIEPANGFKFTSQLLTVSGEWEDCRKLGDLLNIIFRMLILERLIISRGVLLSFRRDFLENRSGI